MAYQASQSPPMTPRRAPSDSDSGVLIKIVATFLGIAVGVMAIIGLWLAISASQARDDAQAALAKVESGSSMSMPMGSTTTAQHGPTSAAAAASPSFAGIAPANADTIATAHHAYPAAMPAIQPGPVATVSLGIEHSTISIAPGIKYGAWTFDGRAPGPVIHVRQGQTVDVTLKNNAPMAHSVDFHAARIAPNVAFTGRHAGRDEDL